jgi:hypothetical protein
VREWFKRQSWKDCVPQGTEGSNPSFSAKTKRNEISRSFLFVVMTVWIRTPEQDFSAEKSCEAVPRPNASGGEHLSRGRIPPSPQKQ